MKAKNPKVPKERLDIKDEPTKKISADEFDSVMRTISSAPPIEKKKEKVIIQPK